MQRKGAVFITAFSAYAVVTIGAVLFVASGCGGGGGGGGGNGGTSNTSPTKDSVLAFTGQVGAGGYGTTMIDTSTGRSQLVASAVFSAWSPDARKIAYSRLAPSWGGLYQLFTMNPDGTGTLQVTSDNAGYYRCSWSPDGGRIAAERNDGPLVVMNADGSNAHAITNGTAPVWSPRGDKIAFFASNGNTGLAVINPDGSGLQNLASPPSPSPGWSSSPSWSPDGTRMALSAYEGNIDQIYLVSASDPNGIVPLTSGSVDAVSPVWSPDGSLIAFTGYLSGSGAVFTVKPDGTGVRQLASGSWPTWSPDSKRVAFVRQDPSGQLRLGIVNADGTNAQNPDIPATWGGWSFSSRPLLWAPK